MFHRGNYVKDLSRLGRELSNVIIVDNSPASYIFHPENAVSSSTCTAMKKMHYAIDVLFPESARSPPSSLQHSNMTHISLMTAQIFLTNVLFMKDVDIATSVTVSIAMKRFPRTFGALYTCLLLLLILGSFCESVFLREEGGLDSPLAGFS